MARLRNFLIASCNERGTNLSVVFLDEAQRLFPDDYEHLVTLDNELAERDYMLFVVLVVQSDFSGTAMEKIRSEEHTSELQSLMRISYAVFCLKKKKHYIYISTPYSFN